MAKQSAIVSLLTDAFASLDLGERLAVARAEIAGRIVFTTSFGIEDQAIAHEIFTRTPDIDVVTLDTGRLFPETYRLWAETEQRYGKRIRCFYPDRQNVEAYVAREGIDGFRASLASRQACCFIRKVEPLERALKGANAWIAGLRADQSAVRGGISFASFEETRGLIKLNPLSDWTRERVTEFVRRHGIPYNMLHDRGFLSIGCAPCTRAVAPGEPERAGRWWWEQEEKKECGLHTPEAMRRRAALKANKPGRLESVP